MRSCLPGGIYWFDGAGAGSAAGAGAGAGADGACGGKYWRKCETSAAAKATKANKIKNFFGMKEKSKIN